MQQERDPLNLRSLPLVSPASDDWPAIEAALRKQNGRQRLLKSAGWALAAAASVTLAVGLLVRSPDSLPPADSSAAQPAIAHTNAQAPGANAQASGANAQASGAEAPAPQAAEPASTVDSLIALSQRLETNLRHIRSEVGVMPTPSLIYQVELEDMVAQVDEELSMNPDNTSLWSQRVNLLLDLSQLYRNELRRESHRMASL